VGWVEDKARSAVAVALSGFDPDEPPFNLVRSIERAIRETIEKCAEVAEEGKGRTLYESQAAIRVSQAIRMLARPGKG
jgi:hypothetical protein